MERNGVDKGRPIYHIGYSVGTDVVDSLSSVDYGRTKWSFEACKVELLESLAKR